MTARLLGFAPCHLGCGHKKAMVKVNEGKNPYLFCHGCGDNHPTRNDFQAQLLVKQMNGITEEGRAWIEQKGLTPPVLGEDPVQEPNNPPPQAEAEPGKPGQGAASVPPPADEKPAPRRVGLWEQMVGGAR